MSGKKGFTLFELIAVLIAVVLLGLIALYGLLDYRAHRHGVNRAVCKSNISSVGKALAMYADSYDGCPPFIDSSPKGWAIAPTGSNMDKPKVDGTSQYNITAFLFLLVRYGQGPGIFVCPADKTAKVDYDTKDPNAGAYNWDFHSAQNVSYSYQCPVKYVAGAESYRGSVPKCGFVSGFSSSTDSSCIILADKTPTASGLDTAATDWADPNLTDQQERDGMSQNHTHGEYMNLLCADTHVQDAIRANVGIDGDNIFSCAESELVPSPSSTGLIIKPETSPKGGMTIEKHLSDKDSFLLGPK